MKTYGVIGAVALCAVIGNGGAFAETITIDPGNGVVMDVQQRITGAADVVVNSGATGGGIVTLANPYNTYTGATTLNSGTLVATALGGDVGSSLGLTSGFTLGAGTFRYIGADGAFMPIPVASAFTSASTKSCVLDVQSDLVVTTNWTQHYGTFIKTGPGTVTFRGNNNFFGAVDSSTLTATLNGNSAKLAFNANGDGPTAGVRGGFVLAEGKMVIEGDDATTNYINSSTTYGAIGTWTADAGGQEKSAVLEIRGGYNVMPRSCWLGYHNGTASTGGENVSSGIRVTGGYLRVGVPGGAVSSSETIFVGGQTSPNGTQRSNPFIEVSGGTLDIGKNLQLGNQGGVNTRLAISGDGRLITGQYIGNGYSATGNGSAATNSVTVSGNGYLETRYVEMFKNAGDARCDVNLLDDATFAWTVTNMPAFCKENSTTKGVMNVLIDGGTVSNSFMATKAHEVAILHAKTDRVAIGKRGATFVSDARNTVQFVFGLNVPFVATNTVEGMEQQPVNFLCGNSNKTTYKFYSAFNWPGSLRVGPYAYVYVQGAGGSKFATEGTFIHCRDARLLSNVDSPVFKDYQIGEKGVVDGAATVFLTTGTHIEATNSVCMASNTRLHVYMRASGIGWLTGGTQFTTPGDYTVLIVPESSRSELERIAATATYAYADNCRSGFHIVDNGNGTLSLKLSILSGASGATTVVTDFADGAELGLGTLEYAGAGEETTGFTLNALGAAVLKTSGTLTVTGGVDTTVGALVKTGAADLRLAGSGTYDFVGADVEWSTTASDNEIGANGESPAAGFKGLSVREGKVIVGRQPDDAPTVTASSLSVGSNPAETDVPAELIVSNGIVRVAAQARISPAVGKQNRIELSGGTLSVGGTLHAGNMSGMDVAGVTPGRIEINDGGHLELLGSCRIYNGDMGEMEIVLNEGGMLSAHSDVVTTQSSTPYRGTLRFNGGVYSYATADAAPYLRYMNFFVGAKGAVFDGEERYANGGDPTTHYLHIGGAWAKDPSLGVDPDGGIVFRGRAMFYLGGSFTSSIEGPVVVKDQAQLMSIRYSACDLSVYVKPGCGVRSYQNSNTYITMFKDLMLGETETPGHARLEIRGASDALPTYAIVVSNEFATLSPVCVSARTTYNSLTPAIAVGVFTAVVYRAECDANVDVSKFYLDPEIASRTATFAKADISSGAYAGWKAVTLEVASGTPPVTPDDASGYARWTSTAAGGAWSVPGNWDNGVLPDATHWAVFGVPGAAGVVVNLDVEPSLERLRIEGTDTARGYVFGGSGPFEFGGGAFSSAQIEIAGGSHRFAAPLKTSGLLMMNAAAGATVEIDGTTGSGTLKLNASGETTTGRYEVHGVGCALAAGFGRTEVDDLSFAWESGMLMLGNGTLAYTGASPADDVHLAFAPNRTIANVAAVFENEADVRVTEATGGESCALIKTGTGVFALGGTSSMQFKGTASFSNSELDLIGESGNAPINCFRGLSVAQGTVVIGAVGDDANAPSVSSDQACVGLYCSPVASGTAANLVVNNGTLDLASNLLIGNFAMRNESVFNVKYEQNGGAVNVGGSIHMGYAGSGTYKQTVSGCIVLNGGRLTVEDSLFQSHGRCQYSGQTNTVFVNGGVLEVKNVVGVNYVQSSGDPAPSATSVNDGEFNVSRNYTFAYRKNESHTLELNGGVFRLGGYMKATTNNAACTGVTAQMKFNGGEFRPLVAAPSVDDAIDVLVGEEGAAISTEEAPGGVCTLAMSFKHDPSIEGLDGGLAKRGKGTLVLSAGNTYTGPTIVEEGVLQIAGDAVATGLVRVDYGAALDLGGGSRTVAGVIGGGVVRNGTVVFAGTMPVSDELPFLDCDLATVPGATIDFGHDADDPVPYGTKVRVAQLGGSAVGELRFKAVNCCTPCSLDTSVENGFVYVRVKAGGTLVIFK